MPGPAWGRDNRAPVQSAPEHHALGVEPTRGAGETPAGSRTADAGAPPPGASVQLGAP